MHLKFNSFLFSVRIQKQYIRGLFFNKARPGELSTIKNAVFFGKNVLLKLLEMYFNLKKKNCTKIQIYSRSSVEAVLYSIRNQ